MWLTFSYFFIAYTTLLGVVQGLAITYISGSQIKDFGETVELKCTVQHAEDYPVSWVKVDPKGDNDHIYITTGSAVLIPDNRFSVRKMDKDSTYLLQIKELQKNDAGNYLCQISLDKNSRIYAEVELLVGRRPVILANTTKAVSARQGQEVILECYADGYPEPQISWKREYNALLPNGETTLSGNILKISAIKKEERGTYYCIAENSIGKSARHSTDVHVEIAPGITVPSDRKHLNQSLGQDINLACHVEAYPPPALTWYKDEVQLTNNQHYSISHFSTADEVTDTVLRVVNITTQEYGNYSCKAVNKLGDAKEWIELSQTDAPSAL